MELILQALCVALTASSVGLGASWAAGALAEAYARGNRIRSESRVSGKTLWGGSDWSWLNGPVSVVTPALEGIRLQGQGTSAAGFRRFLADSDRALVRAGLRRDLAPLEIAAYSVLAAVAGAVLMLAMTLLSGLAWPVALLLSAAAGAVGSLAPRAALDSAAANRVSLIEKRLPFALEFIVLAMEARSSLEAAVQVYIEHVQADPMAEELASVLHDMERRREPAEAFGGLAERIDSPGVSAFALAVRTGLENGQPIRQILRTQSDVARQRRYQSAEVIAKEASARATFPLMVVAVAAMILLVGPLLMRMAQQSPF
ncbi:MAG: hypothetical protein GC160_04375 [Acidobacteria bacterium]|nr:hypothetical protein [Acidobacteriota bacterium]